MIFPNRLPEPPLTFWNKLCYNTYESNWSANPPCCGFVLVRFYGFLTISGISKPERNIVEICFCVFFELYPYRRKKLTQQNEVCTLWRICP